MKGAVHPDEADLLASGRGRRGPRDDSWRHLEGCAECQARLADLERRLPPVAPEAPVPSWRTLKASMRFRRRRIILSWASVAAASLGVMVLLPKLGPTAAPFGYDVVLMWIEGRAMTLHPVAASGGTVRLAIDRSTGWAHLTGADLPRLAPGQVYEVWWIRGSRHLPAGTFVPSGTGSVSLWMRSPDHFAAVDAVGITREPAPGTSRPSGPREYAAHFLARSD